ncbi:hypothetical protein AMJ51_00685 [Microgenomates bacterium DG_75]|nr:MAG: hypothetical protein AMJ51_00685 [Microgenomates bacterium DG_75]
MKKYYHFDSRRFVVVDSRHNIFHWLITVIIRVIISSIMMTLSVYSAAIGYSLSADTIKPYLPNALTEKVVFYSAQLPYFQLINQFIFSRLDHWYRDAFVWWGIVVGIPLILLGITIFLSNLFSLYYTIFSPSYNRTHCPFCKQPIKVV